MRSRAIVAVLICALATTARASSAPVPSCSDPGDGWCVARRFAGDVPGGELGFRFGEPLDVDGDGRADVAAGSRFKRRESHQAGRAAVWSGATGTLIRAWDGDATDALLGHWVLPLSDLDGDDLADLLIAAPIAAVDGAMRGLVVARSPKTGDEIWRRAGGEQATFGWDLAPAGDHDGDGRPDVFVGQPAASGGRVYLLSGKDGRVLREYAPPEYTSAFGWVVARADDLDGDGHPDLAVGAPPGRGPEDPPGGAAYVLSSRRGDVLHRWQGTDSASTFGEMVAAVGDLDDDRRGEIAVASPGTDDQARARRGELRIFSGANGALLRHWSGTQAGELYGRMVVGAGDLDGDATDDLAIGAPWHRTAAGDRVGRVELRSGRRGTVLGELVGDGPGSWFGWHVRRAPDPEGRGRPALLIGSLRHPAGGAEGTGVIDLYVFRSPAAREAHPEPAGTERAVPAGRRAPEPADTEPPGPAGTARAAPAADQGTVTRGARRSDIK
jgi:hypothetical protein